MSTLSAKRCFNHADREAVALCPECRRFFCRECVTEHGGRVLCAACLAERTQSDSRARRRMALVRPMAAAASFVLLWICFVLLGRALLELPDEFHEGAYWAPGVLEEGEP
jgi:hypothetical protein